MRETKSNIACQLYSWNTLTGQMSELVTWTFSFSISLSTLMWIRSGAVDKWRSQWKWIALEWERERKNKRLACWHASPLHSLVYSRAPRTRCGLRHLPSSSFSSFFFFFLSFSSFTTIDFTLPLQTRGGHNSLKSNRRLEKAINRYQQKNRWMTEASREHTSER